MQPAENKRAALAVIPSKLLGIIHRRFDDPRSDWLAIALHNQRQPLQLRQPVLMTFHDHRQEGPCKSLRCSLTTVIANEPPSFRADAAQFKYLRANTFSVLLYIKFIEPVLLSVEMTAYVLEIVVGIDFGTT